MHTDSELLHQLMTWQIEERQRAALEQANEDLRKAMEAEARG